ncbi:hypothetical protein SAMN06265795_12339 [Noviherbaspirillum humi]|uniref:Uncharacterized protein n=1 Tax=Noviherbaspirillum humi TaxID=1688639 RepID=A0A239LJ53_9BURK|nr:hypothetical protein [Noviherbaspirillum humi]SNT30310.1 hypothetical protein SAMN06265795_12339 [Noviherbaspirillum humi]
MVIHNDDLHKTTSQHTLNFKGLDEITALFDCLIFMTHPDDGHRRKLLSAWCQTGKFLRETDLLADEDVVMSKQELALLFEGGTVGVARDISNAQSGGVAAGMVLIALLWMGENEISDPGLLKAYHIAEKIHFRAKDQHNKYISKGNKSVRNNWKEFQNVAHLWAAFVLLGTEADFRDEIDGVKCSLNGTELASLALSLQVHASKLSRPRPGMPLLPSTAVKIEGVSTRSFNLSKFSEQFRKALETYGSH